MWIFVYGSLMADGWEKPFDCKRRVTADLPGFVRSFTKASTRNWGSVNVPGPTLRIVASAGGACRGVAFEFSGETTEAVIAHWVEREGKGFVPHKVDIVLNGEETVSATTFHYEGRRIIATADTDEVAAMVLQARGTSGSAIKYLTDARNTLSQLGIADAAVEELGAAVDLLWGKRRTTLDENTLILGDIILTSDNTFGSKGIRAVTKGEVSHAMIYVGHASVIDAMPEGVHARNTQRMYFDEGLSIYALRLKAGLSAQDAKGICQFARAQVGRQYAMVDAARVVVGKGKQPSRKQFCSRLVAQAYASVGQQLVANEHYCSPDDLRKSVVLIPIENAIRPATDSEVEQWDQQPDIPQQMRDATNAFLGAARKKDSTIQDFNDVNQHLIAHPKDDAYLLNALRKSGYLDLWRTEKDLHPWRYDATLMDGIDPNREDIREYCLATATMDDGGYRYAQNREGYEQLYGQFGFGTFKGMADLYVILDDDHQRRLSLARAWLVRHDPNWATDAGRILVPHTPEWFSTLDALNPMQAEMTRLAISTVGRDDICSVCGDDPATDYKLPMISTPSGATMTCRLCDDCLGIRLADGEALVPLDSSSTANDS
jgi:cation transport regulator ChaC